MGAGCYYTHKETGTKAYWVSTDFARFDDEGELREDGLYLLDVEDMEENLSEIFYSLGYEQMSVNGVRKGEHFNGLFNVKLESTYHGDGVLIYLEPRYFESPYYQLAMANHDKAYDRIMREVNKHYEVCIATSAWTSSKLEIGSL